MSAWEFPTAQHGFLESTIPQRHRPCSLFPCSRPPAPLLPVLLLPVPLLPAPCIVPDGLVALLV